MGRTGNGQLTVLVWRLVANNSIVMQRGSKNTPAKSTQQKQNKKQKRKNNRSRNQTMVTGSDSMMNFTSTPISQEIGLKNPTAFNITGRGLQHSDWGPAIRATGRQQLVYVNLGSGTFQAFTSGIASAVSGNYTYLNPGTLNDRVGYFAALFLRYAFRKVRYTYVTKVPTTVGGSFAMAYYNDSGIIVSGDFASLSYAAIQSTDPCKIIPYRRDFDTLEMEYTGERVWYCSLNTFTMGSSAEAYRQAVQGLLAGFPDVLSTTTAVQGEIYVEYIIDFYSPCTVNNNATLSMLFPGEDEFTHTLSIFIAAYKKALAENNKVAAHKALDVLRKDISVNAEFLSLLPPFGVGEDKRGNQETQGNVSNMDKPQTIEPDLELRQMKKFYRRD